MPRVALIHDFLLDLRGAERVFAAICDAWPDADVFTAVYDEKGTEGRFASRDPQAPPRAFDVIQVVLLVSALVAEAVALWAIAARITEFGFSPNRVVALGVNLILLVNLAWSAVLYVRFLRGRGSFTSLEKWQTDYLPVYGAWAAMVVILFPPLFRYI